MLKPHACKEQEIANEPSQSFKESETQMNALIPSRLQMLTSRGGD